MCGSEHSNLPPSGQSNENYVVVDVYTDGQGNTQVQVEVANQNGNGNPNGDGQVPGQNGQPYPQCPFHPDGEPPVYSYGGNPYRTPAAQPAPAPAPYPQNNTNIEVGVYVEN